MCKKILILTFVYLQYLHVPLCNVLYMFCFFRCSRYDLSGNENDAEKDEEQNEENLVTNIDEEKHQLRLQNDWIARSLTSIGN